jgi:type II secretory pathway component GspD/PulD (secretin)
MPKIPQDNTASFFCVKTVALSLALTCASYAQQAPAPVPPKTDGASKTSTDASREFTKSQLREADDAYLEGARLLDRGDLAAAEKAFLKASKIVPRRPEYVQAATLAHEHRVTELVQQAGRARLLGHPEQADTLLAQASRLDPENNIVSQHMNIASEPQSHLETQVRSAGLNPFARRTDKLAGPIALSPSPGPKDLYLRGTTQQVIQQAFSLYGIRTVMDESVTNQPIRIDLEKVGYERASDVVLSMAHAFAVPLDEHTVIVAKDTQQNRERLEPQLEETIYVPGFTSAQMKELGTVVQNVFDVKKASIQSNGGTIAIRAPQDTISAIDQILTDLVDGGAEVVLDINLYSVDRTRQRKIGAQLPQQIGVYNAESAAHDIVSANQSLVDQAISQGLVPADANDVTIALALISSGLVQSSLLANTIGFFGGGLTMSGLTTNTATTFQLALNSSDTRVLDTIKLRLGDRETGTFRSGTRYPIITSTYSSGITGLPGSLAGATINGVSAQSLVSQATSVTIPQIQFEDLGLTMKATPTVQKSGQVTMQLDLKIEALGSSSLNNIPVLANRQYVSTITVKDGESALLASSLSRTEAAAVSGLPGLGELPGFQTATADKVSELDTSQLVLLITPHIVRHRKDNTAGPRIAFERRLPD